MKPRYPLHPKHPERICWGCDKYCPAERMACGNGSERAMHPAEIFGEDWHLFAFDAGGTAEAEPGKETKKASG